MEFLRDVGFLCWEFTGHRWVPLTKDTDAGLWCFLWAAPWINSWVNNRNDAYLRRHRAHYDVIVMYTHVLAISLTNVGAPSHWSWTSCGLQHINWIQVWSVFQEVLLNKYILQWKIWCEETQASTSSHMCPNLVLWSMGLYLMRLTIFTEAIEFVSHLFWIWLFLF